MSQNKELNGSMQLNINSIDYMLENVMNNVLQDIDEFLPVINPRDATKHSNNNQSNNTTQDKISSSIYDEMLLNMSSLAYNKNINEMNMNTNMNIQYEHKYDGDITPNTSYNSLASLNSSITETD
eukprot:165679_1